MAPTQNIVVAGLGGQGVLKITDILAEVLFDAGFDVKKSEVHGMSQRGGSVSSEVRYGESIASPMIPWGEADILVAVDATQVEVNIGNLKKGGVLITPADVPADRIGNPRAFNMLMLGALSSHIDLPEALFYDKMAKFLPEKVREVNFKAFELGRKGK